MKPVDNSRVQKQQQKLKKRIGKKLEKSLEFVEDSYYALQQPVRMAIEVHITRPLTELSNGVERVHDNNEEEI